MAGNTVSRSSIWIYGSLGFPLALLGYPLGIWLPRAYDTYIGIDTALVGSGQIHHVERADPEHVAGAFGV